MSFDHAIASKKVKTVQDGVCAVVVMAGGDGSRLGFKGPKGCFPIMPISRHSLFQRLAEKIFYANRLDGQPIPLAVMTSPINHKATVAHFTEHRFFGLNEESIDFFVQPTLPLLDDAYQPLHQADGCGLTAPDGNGSVFYALASSGILDKWHALGVKYVSLIPIDNPLAMPFDRQLVALQQKEAADAALVVVSRVDLLESVGLVKAQGARVFITEYSELTEQEKNSFDGAVNTSLFSFTLEFMQKAASFTFPIHYARKAVQYQGKQVMAYKQERFVFDVLALARKTSLLKRAREECFAPLKQQSGATSPVAVQKALMQHDHKWLGAYLEKNIPDGPIELSPCFYYPTEALKTRWQEARRPVNGYYGEHP